MIKIITSLLLLLFSLACLEAEVLRPKRLPHVLDLPQPCPVACMPTETDYGPLIQKYDSVLLVGNTDDWWGVGKVLPDGTLQLLWIGKESTCWSEYKVDKAGNLVGGFSYAKDCTILENGRVFPLVHSHTIWTRKAHR